MFDLQLINCIRAIIECFLCDNDMVCEVEKKEEKKEKKLVFRFFFLKNVRGERHLIDRSYLLEKIVFARLVILILATNDIHVK